MSLEFGSTNGASWMKNSVSSMHSLLAPAPLLLLTLWCYRRYLASVYAGLLQLVGENIDPKTSVERTFAIAVILCADNLRVVFM